MLGSMGVERAEDAGESVGLAAAGEGEGPWAEPSARKVALAWADDGASRAPPAKPGEAGCCRRTAAPGAGMGTRAAGGVTLTASIWPTVRCPFWLALAGNSPPEVGLPGAVVAAAEAWESMGFAKPLLSAPCAGPWSGARGRQVV